MLFSLLVALSLIGNDSENMFRLADAETSRVLPRIEVDYAELAAWSMAADADVYWEFQTNPACGICKQNLQHVKKYLEPIGWEFSPTGHIREIEVPFNKTLPVWVLKKNGLAVKEHVGALDADNVARLRNEIYLAEHNARAPTRGLFHARWPGMSGQAKSLLETITQLQKLGFHGITLTPLDADGKSKPNRTLIDLGPFSLVLPANQTVSWAGTVERQELRFSPPLTARTKMLGVVPVDFQLSGLVLVPAKLELDIPRFPNFSIELE